MDGLMLGRKESQTVVITASNGERIVVTLLKCKRAKLNFVAPRSVEITRGELIEKSEAAA